MCLLSQGLLNKQQQILEFLGSENDQPRPREYRFWFDQRPITISTWASVLRKSLSSEIVDIWMRKDPMKIVVHSVEGRRTTIEQPTFPITDLDMPHDPGHVAIISPFFAWKIIDEFGDTDQVSLSDRVDRFLKAVFGRVAAEANIQVSSKTQNQVHDLLQTIKKNSIAFELAQNFQLIFSLYVPTWQYSASRPVEMYWGAVHEIVKVRLCALQEVTSIFATNSVK